MVMLLKNRWLRTTERVCVREREIFLTFSAKYGHVISHKRNMTKSP